MDRYTHTLYTVPYHPWSYLYLQSLSKYLSIHRHTSTHSITHSTNGQIYTYSIFCPVLSPIFFLSFYLSFLSKFLSIHRHTFTHSITPLMARYIHTLYCPISFSYSFYHSFVSKFISIYKFSHTYIHTYTHTLFPVAKDVKYYSFILYLSI